MPKNIKNKRINNKNFTPYTDNRKKFEKKHERKQENEFEKVRDKTRCKLIYLLEYLVNPYTARSLNMIFS